MSKVFAVQNFFTLRGKLVSGIIVILIVYILLGYFSFRSTNAAFMLSTGKRMSDLAEVMLDKIGETIYSQKELLVFFSSSPRLQNILKTCNQKAKADQNYVPERNKLHDLSLELNNRFIHNFQIEFGHRYFSGVFITNAYGQVIASTHDIGDKNLIPQETWERVLQEGFIFGSMLDLPQINVATMDIMQKVEDDQGQTLGMIVVCIPSTWIMRKAQLTGREDLDLEVQLTDSDGKLLYSSQPFRYREDVSQEPFYQRSKKEKSFFILDKGPSKRLYALANFKRYKSIRAQNWNLFVSSAEKELMQPFANLQFKFLLIYLVVGLVIMLVGYYLSRTISRPLLRLQDAARSITKGELSQEVKIESEDELGNLAKAFNTMSKELHSSYESLKRENAQRRQAEEQLKNINKDLERSNEELDSFAYIVSHDLRKPLRGIHNYSSFLLEDYEQDLEEEGRQKLNTIMNLTKRLENQIESILIYSRVGRLDQDLAEVDLNKIVEEVLESLEYSIKEKQVDIQITSRLPTITCDKVRITDIFFNLISNAIKYNDKEEKKVSIGWYSKESQDSQKPVPVFFVQDNGIGIREKHIISVFRIFKRLHGRDKYGGGVGAGLTIARKIVERHGGEIWVQSTYGQGSTFYFTLQRENENDEQNKAAHLDS